MSKIAKRDIPERHSAEFIRECTLHIENEIRRKIPRPGQWWIEHELTGRRRGTLTATIGNFAIDPTAIVGVPCIFDWPDAKVLIGMVIRSITLELRPGERLAHVEGEVLGIREYDNSLPPAEARQQLALEAGIP